MSVCAREAEVVRLSPGGKLKAKRNKLRAQDREGIRDRAAGSRDNLLSLHGLTWARDFFQCRADIACPALPCLPA